MKVMTPISPSNSQGRLHRGARGYTAP